MLYIQSIRVFRLLCRLQIILKHWSFPFISILTFMILFCLIRFALCIIFMVHLHAVCTIIPCNLSQIQRYENDMYEVFLFNFHLVLFFPNPYRWIIPFVIRLICDIIIYFFIWIIFFVMEFKIHNHLRCCMIIILLVKLLPVKWLCVRGSFSCLQTSDRIFAIAAWEYCSFVSKEPNY